MQLQGAIHSINPTRQPSETFSVREFILDTSTESNGRPVIEYVGCQVTNKNCILLDEYKPGDVVKIDASIGSSSIGKNKKGEDSVINNVTAWRIKKVEAAPATQGGDTGEKAPW